MTGGRKKGSGHDPSLGHCFKQIIRRPESVHTLLNGHSWVKHIFKFSWHTQLVTSHQPTFCRKKRESIKFIVAVLKINERTDFVESHNPFCQVWIILNHRMTFIQCMMVNYFPLRWQIFSASFDERLSLWCVFCGVCFCCSSLWLVGWSGSWVGQVTCK